MTYQKLEQLAELVKNNKRMVGLYNSNTRDNNIFTVRCHLVWL